MTKRKRMDNPNLDSDSEDDLKLICDSYYSDDNNDNNDSDENNEEKIEDNEEIPASSQPENGTRLDIQEDSDSSSDDSDDDIDLGIEAEIQAENEIRERVESDYLTQVERMINHTIPTLTNLLESNENYLQLRNQIESQNIYRSDIIKFFLFSLITQILFFTFFSKLDFL